MKINLRRLKELVQQGPADVIVGKAGLSEGVIGEIKRRLELKGVIKVKFLKSALKTEGVDRKEIARRLAEKVDAIILDIRGRTAVLYSPKHAKKIKISLDSSKKRT